VVSVTDLKGLTHQHRDLALRGVMATATFDDSGNITATGKEAMPNVAEGLGASNIKGVNDSKVQTDIENEAGREQVHDTPMTDRPPQAGADGASGETTIAGDALRGRVKDTMGSAKS